MKTVNFPLLIVCITVPLLAGGVSGFITADAITGWYLNLQKPSFNPPNYVFGPVWTLLYTLMGISLYLVLNSANKKDRNDALVIFSVQLFLNFFWSIFFFYFERPDLALVVIAALLLSISYMIFVFKNSRPIAGYLQIPYLLWVSFATLLNASIWWLNR